MNSEENKKIRKHFRTKKNEEKKEEYSQQQKTKIQIITMNGKQRYEDI